MPWRGHLEQYQFNRNSVRDLIIIRFMIYTRAINFHFESIAFESFMVKDILCIRSLYSVSIVLLGIIPL